MHTHRTSRHVTFSLCNADKLFFCARRDLKENADEDDAEAFRWASACAARRRLSKSSNAYMRSKTPVLKLKENADEDDAEAFR